MRLSKMLRIDTLGVQKVLGLSNEEIIESLEGLQKIWLRIDCRCPLEIIVYTYDERAVKMAEAAILEHDDFWCSDRKYSFQPYGVRGSSWWADLTIADQKEQLNLLIKFFKKRLEEEEV